MTLLVTAMLPALLAALLAAPLALLPDAGPEHAAPAAPSVSPAATGSVDPAGTRVDFPGAGGIVLHGLVLTPPTAAAWHRGPGLVPIPGAGPRQDTRSRELAPLRWYESTWFQAVATLLCLTGFAGYALTGAVRRIRGRSRPDALPRAARWAAATGTAALLGGLGYLLFLVVTAAMFPGPVLFGRPVAWLAVQLLALVALGSAVVAAGTALRRRAALATAPGLDRARLGALLPAAALFTPWALSWGLLLP
ncbi:hypothetical protein ACFZDG_21090 [Kitasatospora xanthocidica]|uniref:hypothetical protein n=1 Tax=Kitasatospora xanthocidica TaxID=83382 RepID=UPI0036E114C6